MARTIALATILRDVAADLKIWSRDSTDERIANVLETIATELEVRSR